MPYRYVAIGEMLRSDPDRAIGKIAVAYANAGLNLSQTARDLGVARWTLLRWQREHPELAERLARVRKAAFGLARKEASK